MFVAYRAILLVQVGYWKMTLLVKYDKFTVSNIFPKLPNNNILIIYIRAFVAIVELQLGRSEVKHIG